MTSVPVNNAPDKAGQKGTDLPEIDGSQTAVDTPLFFLGPGEGGWEYA
jgi:hypothetical protein